MGTYVDEHLGKDEFVIHTTTLHWMCLLSLRGFISLFILPLLDFLSTEIAITNKKVVGKYGYVGRRTLEMNLNKIESIAVTQSIFGRIFDYGTLTVIGTGGTKEILATINRPLEFRKIFMETESLPSDAFRRPMPTSLKTEISSEERTTEICNSCKSKISESAKFCPECGTKKKEDVCSQCGWQVNPSAKFCGGCGKKLSETN